MIMRAARLPFLLLALGGASAGCNGSTDIADKTSGTTGHGASSTGGEGGQASTSTTATTATTGTGAGTGGDGAGGNGVAYPAPHPSMPVIPSHGGKVLSAPSIVTVTFTGDPNEAKEQELDDTIGTFDWWTKAVTPYGVGPASGGGHVTLADVPPAAMSDADFETWLSGKIEDGSLPPATDQTIYAVYLPASNVITFSAAEGGGSSCQAFLGYHSSIVVMQNGVPVTTQYAVIDLCDTDLDNTTTTASHEIAEASSDPTPLTGQLGYVITGDNAWTLAGGENADMCAEVGGYTENGFTLTRVWNNANAKNGDQPCVPVNDDPSGTDVPYFNAAIVKPTLSGKPGDTVTTEIDCYSFGPLPSPMQLSTQGFSKSLSFDFDQLTCVNGDKVTLSITISANAKSGSEKYYSVYAALDDNTSHIWRGIVRIQ